MDPRSRSGTVTAALLLPPELVLATLALTHPTANVPATCRLIATAFRSGDPTRLERSWHNTIIFHLEGDLKRAVDYEDTINEWFEGAQQIRSRLAVFLKSRLPLQKLPVSGEGDGPDTALHFLGPYAGCLAPDTPHNDAFIHQGLVDYLFSKCGPFSRQSALQSDQIHAILQSFWSTKSPTHTANQDDDEEADELNQLHFEYRIHHPSHRYWQLIPDAIQLAIYFLRAGDAALFHHTLTHLHRAVPSLATTMAPLFHWVALDLDNRQDTRQAFDSAYYDEPHVLVSFPLFLATLCAFDMSTPCIDAVVQVYNLDLHNVATWLSADWIMDCMLDTLPNVSTPARAIDFLAWLTQRAVSLDFAFPLAARATSWPLFVCLFREYDQPMLDQIEDMDRRSLLGLSIFKFAMQSRKAGGEEIRNEVDEVVRIAFGSGLMDAKARGELYFLGFYLRDAREWQEVVESNTVGEDDWMSVLHHAIQRALASFLRPSATGHNATRSALSRLLNQLDIINSVTPTAYFTRYGHEWTWADAHRLFDDKLVLNAPWDLIACASQVAEWISSPSVGPTCLSLLDRVEVLCRILDLAVHTDDVEAVKGRLAAQSIDKLAVMVVGCACQLGIGQRSLSERECVDGGCDSLAPLPRTRMLVMDVWSDVAGRHSASSHSSRVPTHLSRAAASLVHQAASEKESIAGESTAADPPSDLALRIARGDTNLGHALAILIEFDPDFVVENMVWTDETPFWLWQKFRTHPDRPRLPCQSV